MQCQHLQKAEHHAELAVRSRVFSNLQISHNVKMDRGLSWLEPVNPSLALTWEAVSLNSGPFWNESGSVEEASRVNAGQLSWGYVKVKLETTASKCLKKLTLKKVSCAGTGSKVTPSHPLGPKIPSAKALILPSLLCRSVWRKTNCVWLYSRGKSVGNMVA